MTTENKTREDAEWNTYVRAGITDEWRNFQAGCEYARQEQSTVIKEKDERITELEKSLDLILTYKAPDYLKIVNGETLSLFEVARSALKVRLSEERIEAFHAGYTSQKEKILSLNSQIETQTGVIEDLRKDLKEALSLISHFGTDSSDDSAIARIEGRWNL